MDLLDLSISKFNPKKKEEIKKENDELKSNNLSSSMNNVFLLTNQPVITDDFSSNNKYMEVIQALSVGVFGTFLFSYVVHLDSIFNIQINPNMLTGAYTGFSNSTIVPLLALFFLFIGIYLYFKNK